MVEEDLLHRGEIICMLWQDDIAPPTTSHLLWRYETNPRKYSVPAVSVRNSGAGTPAKTRGPAGSSNKRERRRDGT